MTGFSLRALSSFLLVGCLSLGGVSAWAQTEAPAPAATSVAARSKALSTLLADIWQDRLRHSPEFASLIGDKRYNDQLTDYSVKEVNASLQRGLDYIQRLGAIDTTGLTDQEKLSSELMLRSLIDAQQGAKFKEWEMPISPIFGFQTRLADLVGQLSFDSVKDYDDYIERLKKVPVQFSQVMTNLQLGVDEGRMPPKESLEKASGADAGNRRSEGGGECLCSATQEISEDNSGSRPEAHCDGLDGCDSDAGAADVSAVREVHEGPVCAEWEKRSRCVGDAQWRRVLCLSHTADNNAGQDGRSDTPDRTR